MNVDALSDDLYRMGRSSDPNFSEARGIRDCLTYDRNGIKFVVADGNGFSAFTFIIARMKDPKEKVWKIRKGTPLPQGIQLVKDLREDHQGHFMLAPTGDYNMPHNPSLKARLPEWNTVLDAMRFYSRHLEERRATLDSESDEYLVLGDELIRLDGLIPDFERQIKELTDRAVAESLVYHER